MPATAAVAVVGLQIDALIAAGRFTRWTGRDARPVGAAHAGRTRPAAAAAVVRICERIDTERAADGLTSGTGQHTCSVDARHPWAAQAPTGAAVGIVSERVDALRSAVRQTRWAGARAVDADLSRRAGMAARAAVSGISQKIHATGRRPGLLARSRSRWPRLVVCKGLEREGDAHGNAGYSSDCIASGLTCAKRARKCVDPLCRPTHSVPLVSITCGADRGFAPAKAGFGSSSNVSSRRMASGPTATSATIVPSSSIR